MPMHRDMRSPLRLAIALSTVVTIAALARGQSTTWLLTHHARTPPPVAPGFVLVGAPLSLTTFADPPIRTPRWAPTDVVRRTRPAPALPALVVAIAADECTPAFATETLARGRIGPATLALPGPIDTTIVGLSISWTGVPRLEFAPRTGDFLARPPGR
jgi:hypothetical protein